MGLFDFQKPEVTTIIRWLLRVVLVLFLAWLVRRKPDEEEDAEEEPQEVRGRGPNSQKNQRGVQGRPGGRMQQSQQYQQPPQRYNNLQNTNLRQRREQGGSVDFDSVIDKMSKPKEMWEVRKSGDGTSQVFKRLPSDKSGGSFDSRPSGGNVPNLEDVLGGSMGSINSIGSRDSAISTSGARPPSAAAKAAAYTAARDKKAEENTKTLHGHERPVTYITWNRDNKLLFTCGKDKIVCVYSFPEGEQLGVYHGHSGAVWACSVTSDSRWLVTSGADRLVIVWEARTSRELARVELPGVVRFCEWARSEGNDGEKTERFVTCHNRFGAQPASLTVWRFDGEALTIEELLRITTLPTAANQVRWGAGDELLASAHENGELVFWSTETGAEVKRLKAHDGNLMKFDFSSDRQVVATVGQDKAIKVWDLGNEGSESTLIYETKTDRPLNAVALGPLTRSVMVGPAGNLPDKCAVIAAGGQDARDVAKSASDSEQFGTLMFKLDSNESLPGQLKADGVTKGHFGPVHTLAFQRDGAAIASGSEDGCVRIHIFDGAAKDVNAEASKTPRAATPSASADDGTATNGNKEA